MTDTRTLAEQLAHCDGLDCRCSARSCGECACDADWTPAEVYRLRADVAARSLDADDARRWRELVETWGGMQARGDLMEIGISTPRWRVPANVSSFGEAFDRRYELEDAMNGANDVLSRAARNPDTAME